MRGWKFGRLSLLVGALSASVTEGVLFHSTGDPAYNTNAPSGALEGSGWDLQGRFRDGSNDKYLGTPIAPRHFITAKHISQAPAVGEPFWFRGVEYVTTEKTHDAVSDLTVWKVDGVFPEYAPLYSAATETGKPFVVFGRGTRRGAAVYGAGSLKGWRWGAKDFVMRWGENVVDGTSWNGYGAHLLRADFDAGGGPNECMLSDKDSGGAWFIQDDGVWKLAGISYAVSPAVFSHDPNGANAFNAALFDYSFEASETNKIYYGSSTWRLLQTSGENPCRFFATRVSSRYGWITNAVSDLDVDVNGLPDAWEAEHGVADSAGDADGDGRTNYEEWLADTDPNEASSFLAVKSLAGGTGVSFAGSTNRKYRVECTESLTNSTWNSTTDWFVGEGAETTTNLASWAPCRFFRLRVTLR